MTNKPSMQRMTFLLAFGGLLALSVDFACNDDACPTERTAQYLTQDEIAKQRIESFDEAALRLGVTLNGRDRGALADEGHLLGVLPVDRPVKHPDGTVEMPTGWLPDLPEGHPWRDQLTPADDAFYSWFEERILDSRLYDPSNSQHRAWADAYLTKSRSASPRFVAWTFASPTECPKPGRRRDSGTNP